DITPWLGEFYVNFEGPVSADRDMLYSRLSKKGKKYVESMEAYSIEAPRVRAVNTIEIRFANATPRYRVEKVISEIERKLGARLVTKRLTWQGTFNLNFEGRIDPNEVFMLYSRRLSKTARKAIMSMRVRTEYLMLPAIKLWSFERQYGTVAGLTEITVGERFDDTPLDWCPDRYFGHTFMPP